MAHRSVRHWQHQTVAEVVERSTSVVGTLHRVNIKVDVAELMFDNPFGGRHEARSKLNQLVLNTVNSTTKVR